MSTCAVYIACADDREIDVWRLHSGSEAMARVERVPVPGISDASSSMPLALSPDRRHLYAGLRAPPYPVLTFAIDPDTGALTQAATARLPGSMCYLATDRTGRMLLSASYDGAIVGVNRIGFDGVAGELIHTLDTPPKAHSVIPSPDNRFAYAASLGGDRILAWPMDPLTGLQADGIRQYALPAGAGPRHILFGAPGTLYAINEIDGTVAVFAHDGGTGALTLRQTLETAPQNGAGGAAAADIHLTPDGRLLYASIRSTNRIAAFRVSRADGTLEALGQYPVEDTPRAFAITPDGAFLVSAGRNSASVGLYAIDRVDGALAQVARYMTGANPNWVEMVPLPE